MPVQPSLVRLRYIDNDLTTSTCQINIPLSIDPDVLLSQASLWQTLIDALSSAICIERDIVLRETTDAPPAAGVASSIKRSGTFLFNTNAATLATLRIPSIRSDLILTSGPYAGIAIDVLDTDVQAYTDAIIYGISGVHACDPFASDIVSLSNAMLEQY